MAARGGRGQKPAAPLPGDSSKIRVDPSRALNKASPSKAGIASATGTKSVAAKPRSSTSAVGAKTVKPKSTPSAKSESTSGKSSAALKVNEAKRSRDLQYKAMLDKDMHQKRKAEILESFKKLQVMSVDDLQVELIVCIRAQHYRDALMYSEIILEKDPGNELVAKFQPLLANLSVQANPAVGDDDDEEEDGEGGEDGEEGEDDDDDSDNDSDEEDSDSDDPETAWMWSDTWRTDPDDDPEEGPGTEGPSAERTEAAPARGPTAEKTSP